MKDLNIKVKGFYVREEGIRSIEKTDYGYLVDSIARGMMKIEKQKEIENIDNYIVLLAKRRSIITNKIMSIA